MSIIPNLNQQISNAFGVPAPTVASAPIAQFDLSKSAFNRNVGPDANKAWFNGTTFVGKFVRVSDTTKQTTLGPAPDHGIIFMNDRERISIRSVGQRADIENAANQLALLNEKHYAALCAGGQRGINARLHLRQLLVNLITDKDVTITQVPSGRYTKAGQPLMDFSSIQLGAVNVPQATTQAGAQAPDFSEFE